MSRNGDQHPYAERDPRSLSDGEWRALMSYRMDQIEKRVDGIFKAVWTMAGSILAGVGVWIFTTGRPAAAAAAALRFLT